MRNEIRGAGLLLDGSSRAVLQAERDEAVGRVVGRESDRHPITGDHANAEPAHAARELRSDLLPVFQRDLVATAAEDLIHAAGRLNQVVSRQIGSILPSFAPFEAQPSPVNAWESVRGAWGGRKLARCPRVGDRKGAPDCDPGASQIRPGLASLPARGEVAESG